MTATAHSSSLSRRSRGEHRTSERTPAEPTAVASPASAPATEPTPSSHPGLFSDPLAKRMVEYLRDSDGPPLAMRASIIRHALAECYGAEQSAWPVGVRSELRWAETP